jgi:O-antigen ligase
MGTGIIALIRSIVVWIGINGLYVGGFVIAFLSMYRKAEWGLYVLAVVIPLPTIWYKFADYPLGNSLLDLIFLGILLGVFINKQGYKPTGNAIAVFLFMVVSYLSLWNSSMNFGLPMPITPDNPLLKIWKSYAFMIGMYLLTANGLKDEKQQQLLILVMTIVVLFISVKSLRNFNPGEIYLDDSRDAGPFWIAGLNSNHFGAFAAYCFAFFLGLFLLEENRKRKLLLLATVAAGMYPVLFSYSRGAYAAVLAVLVVFGLVKHRRMLVAVVLILFLWQVVLPSSVVDRIGMTKSEEGVLEASAVVRLDLWGSALSMFERNPLFGSGFKGFTLAFQDQKWSDTHNFYLKVLAEQGIIGILFLLIILFAAFRSGWRLFRQGHTPFQRALGYGFLGCVVAHTVTNLFGDRWSYYEMGSYFWMFWGTVDRGFQLAQTAKKEPVQQDRKKPVPGGKHA